MKIICGMYGLPQAGILANKLLKERLLEHGYYEVQHTPGLFAHTHRPIWFTLVVDDFGIKYIGKEHVDHLFSVLKQHYEIEIDWGGKLYCGISLNWHYDKKYVDIAMPNYVQKQLIKYQHQKPKRPQHCPYQPNPIFYGKRSDEINTNQKAHF